MDIKKVSIIGAGRMGITHYAILRQYLPKASFVIKEMPGIVSHVLKRSLNDDKVKITTKELKDSFDLNFICTPPQFHLSEIKDSIQRKDKFIFVEKPYGLYNQALPSNQNIFVGYVLRFNPVILEFVKIYKSKNLKISKISCSYFSNTLTKPPKGWRNSKHVGVLTEMGCHIIDLVGFITSKNITNVKVLNCKNTSVFSEGEDIHESNLILDDIEIKMKLDWVNKKYRKPVFELKITFSNGVTVKIDQQNMSSINDSDFNVNIVSLTGELNYYLRGVDFSNQIKDMISRRETIAKSSEATAVNLLLNKLKNT